MSAFSRYICAIEKKKNENQGLLDDDKGRSRLLVWHSSLHIIDHYMFHKMQSRR